MDSDFEAIRSHLTSYFQGRSEVIAALLFGSRAQGRARSTSDVDIALFIRPELWPGDDPLGYQAAVLFDLTRRLERDAVDLVVLNDATLPLAYRVISQGRLLFCQDPAVWTAFVVDVKRRYIDTKPLRQIQAQYLYRRIRNGHFSRIPP